MKKLLLSSLLAASLVNVSIASITLKEGDVSAYDQFDATVSLMWALQGTACGGFTEGPSDVAPINDLGIVINDSANGINPNLVTASQHGWTTNIRQCLFPGYSSVHQITFDFYKDGKKVKTCDLTNMLTDPTVTKTITIPEDCPQS